MDIARIIDQLNNGHEFEFIFQGKRYSITQGTIDGQFCFSFCEFYKDSVEASTVSELMQMQYNGITINDMLVSLSMDDIWIF